ncbi:uncharacterized protein K452DRAFT_289345 [Aplosporella prunicola CBS 121167]|uniref:Major facilitator superfamily (MFS) profile domain-containing protein n=1 Tax=Aplosporella prunicola CBS 121167 TaxID=1176127 RepID=A0A6A6B7T0_9PEZI|nr:uncharacterized protein K452DRAFT_289345 [Aplosporella prunicola CBS 121167]KAF2139966.1 hypothetical protein K452DRAFT_289345 [Aplosporella prunicola CBS 121167]
MPAAHQEPPSEASPLLPGSSAASHSSRKPIDREDEVISVSRGTVMVVSLGLIVFLQACNFSLLTTTQSSIAADLDAFEEATWFTSAYLVPMSSITPLAGRLSQIFSPRSCIFTASALFSMGGLITAFAPTVEWFLVGRAVTGVGGAGIFSLVIIIVLQMAGHEHRGLYLGSINSVITTGVSLGAVLGGAIEPRLGWRSVFWLQTPLAVVAGVAIFLSIPASLGARKDDSRTLSQKLAQIDYLGAITLTASITSLLISLSGPKILLIPLILSLILIPTFITIELYFARDPIIPISLLKSRGTLLTCLGTLGFMMARWCVLFYTPVYAIAVRAWAPAAAGSILIPTNAGFAIGGLLAGWIHIRRAGSFYLPSLIAYALFPLTLLFLAFTTTRASPAPALLAAAFSNGLVTGAAVNYTLVHALHLTPTSTHFVLTALVATFRGFAGSFGAALGGGVFARLLRPALEKGFKNLPNGGGGEQSRARLVRVLMGSPAMVPRLGDAEREVAVGAYEGALRGLWVAAAGLAVVVVFVQAGTGWVGHREGDEEGDEQGHESESEEEEEEVAAAGTA